VDIADHGGQPPNVKEGSDGQKAVLVFPVDGMAMPGGNEEQVVMG
jgi:hypothetical protein